MQRNELYYLLINLTTAMNKLGMSYSELAKILGVSPESISRWLRGVQKPSKQNMDKITVFLHLVLDLNLPYEVLTHYFDVASTTTVDAPVLRIKTANNKIKDEELYLRFLDIMVFLIMSYVLNIIDT